MFFMLCALDASGSGALLFLLFAFGFGALRWKVLTRHSRTSKVMTRLCKRCYTNLTKKASPRCHTGARRFQVYFYLTRRHLVQDSRQRPRSKIARIFQWSGLYPPQREDTKALQGPRRERCSYPAPAEGQSVRIFLEPSGAIPLSAPCWWSLPFHSHRNGRRVRANSMSPGDFLLERWSTWDLGIDRPSSQTLIRCPCQTQSGSSVTFRSLRKPQLRKDLNQTSTAAETENGKSCPTPNRAHSRRRLFLHAHRFELRKRSARNLIERPSSMTLVLGMSGAQLMILVDLVAVRRAFRKRRPSRISRVKKMRSFPDRSMPRRFACRCNTQQVTVRDLVARPNNAALDQKVKLIARGTDEEEKADVPPDRAA